MEALWSLTLIWCAVYLATVVARWTRLTPVLWFLFFGALFVNIGLLPKHAHPFIAGLSDLAILLIMFAIGFEEETENFITSLKRSWGIAFFGGLAPFLTAYSVTYYIWQDINIALMCGLAMTATAVSLTMVSLKEEGLSRSVVATRIMTSAIIDDIASLALVAVLVPLAANSGPVSFMDVTVILARAMSFFIVIALISMVIFPHAYKGILSRVPGLDKISIRNFLLFDKGNHATLLVLLLAVGIGLMAHLFGLHPAVGAFMAGLILKREYFHLENEDHIYHETARIIDNIAFSWLGPVFFVMLGAHIIFDPNLFLTVMPYVALLTVALFVAQVASAALAARFTGQMDWPSALMVGFGMLGRAELAFVVMNIAYVQYQIIPKEAFYTLMLTSFWLNILVPVTIRWCKETY